MIERRYFSATASSSGTPAETPAVATDTAVCDGTETAGGHGAK